MRLSPFNFFFFFFEISFSISIASVFFLYLFLFLLGANDEFPIKVRCEKSEYQAWRHKSRENAQESFFHVTLMLTSSLKKTWTMLEKSKTYPKQKIVQVFEGCFLGY